MEKIVKKIMIKLKKKIEKKVKVLIFDDDVLSIFDDLLNVILK